EAPHARERPPVLEEMEQQFRWAGHLVGRHPKSGPDPISLICPPVPVVPVFGRSVNHAYLGMRVERIYLLLELRREIHIISIKERDVFAPRMPDAHVAGGAGALVRSVRVLEVSDALRVLLSIALRDLLTSVRRAVVDEEQLPVRVRLNKDAFYRLLEIGRADV